MRSLVLGFGIALTSSLIFAAACSGAGGGGGTSSGGGTSGAGGSGGTTDGSLGGSGGIKPTGGSDAGGAAGANPDSGCAKFTVEAKQPPTAMLFVVDGSASMSLAQKWGAAQSATVTAIDKDAFDNTSLGLVRFPASFTDPPQCLCDYACGAGCDITTCKLLLGGSGVACGVSFLPQVAIADSGTQKSNQGGVRKSIYDYMVANSPLTNDPSDASPIYDAMVAGYTALKAASVDKRALILITDGGFSCTSLSSPQRPGISDGACPDWEQPSTVVNLITTSLGDAQKPINAFIIGVPGSDSTGQPQGSYATAPYTMRRALSAYALAGSPGTCPANCDGTLPATGAAPTNPCHFDLSQSANFDADKLAAAISTIKGQTLSCTLDMPQAPPGEVIDQKTLNVFETLDGTTSQIPKRTNAADTCDTAPCWDLAGDKIQLIGKACDDLHKAQAAKVDVTVGCTQLVK